MQTQSILKERLFCTTRFPKFYYFVLNIYVAQQDFLSKLWEIERFAM